MMAGRYVFMILTELVSFRGLYTSFSEKYSRQSRDPLVPITQHIAPVGQYIVSHSSRVAYKSNEESG